MNIAKTMISIRTAHSFLSGKTSDISLTYKGTEVGESNPWHVRCENFEAKGVDEQSALNLLFSIIKNELKKKISIAEIQSVQYKQGLSILEN